MAADDTIELQVGGRPISASNPVPTTPGAGADIGGGKTLADVYNELVTLAGAKALSDLVTSLGATGDAAVGDASGSINAHTRGVVAQLVTMAGSKTLADLITILGATNDAAVLDATGTLNAHARGIINELITIAGGKTLANLAQSVLGLGDGSEAIGTSKPLALPLFGDTTVWRRQTVVHGASDNNTGTTVPTVHNLLTTDGGATLAFQRTPKVFKPLSAVVITNETTIWTPTSGKKFRLMGGYLAQGVATGAITLRDNTSGTTILIVPQNTVGVGVAFDLGNGILSAAANNLLTAQGASTETITGYVYGTEE